MFGPVDDTRTFPTCLMTEPQITANMRIRDVMAMHPATLQVFHRYGIRCEDCHASRYESLGQGAQVHGMDVQRLLDDLNHAARTGRDPSVSTTSHPSPATTAGRLPVVRN